MTTSIFSCPIETFCLTPPPPPAQRNKMCYGPALMCKINSGVFILCWEDCVRLYESFPVYLSLPNKHKK